MSGLKLSLHISPIKALANGVFLWFLLLIPGNLWAEIQLKESLQGISTALHMRILEDPEGQLSFQDINSPLGRNRFKPLPGNRTGFGTSRSVYWLSLEAVNKTEKPIRWLISMAHAQFDYVDIYHLVDKENPRILQMGDKRPFTSRPVQFHLFAIPLETPAGKRSRIYVRLAYEQAGIFEFYSRIWSQPPFKLYADRTLLGHGLLMGTLGFALIYNLFILLALRRAEYFWYLVFLLASLFFYLSVSGLGHEYVWSDSPFLTNDLPLLTPILAILLALQFTRSFLDTSRHAPWLDRGLLACIGLSLIPLLLVPTDYRVTTIKLVLLNAILLSLLPIPGIYMLLKGRLEARSFTLAWSFFSLAAGIGLLRVSGYLQSTDTLIWLSRAGFLSETALLSIALVDRINLLRNTKNRIERLYRQELENSHQRLEARVRERTKELESSRDLAEHQARTDPLTGIANRRAFLEKGAKELQRADRYKSPVALIMMDIDHFKSINDTYGHPAGDKVLQAITDLLNNEIRDVDFTGRLGGEEFGLILPETDLDSATFTAERIRSKIQELSIDLKDNHIACTSSFGVATHKQEKEKLEHLLSRADQALYNAKQHGRNRVATATQDGSTSTTL